MKIDLHMHSGYSEDGQLTCSQLAAMAKDRGMDVIALSDHDQMRGVQEMIEAASLLGIEVIPAIECSTLIGEQIVHVLGYGIDINDEYLNGIREKQQAANKDVFAKRAQKLKDKYGLDFTLEEIYEKAAGRNPWFTMINEILKDPKVQNHPDFQDYLPGGKRCDPAPVNFYWDKCTAGSDLHVKSWNPDFYETIDRIHEAGGAAVIAHPFRTFYQNEELLQSAIEKGIDGLEAYSNYHTPEMNEWYADFAAKNGLLITCGSDFHGINKPSIVMGEYGFEGDGQPIYENLKERMHQRKREAKSR